MYVHKHVQLTLEHADMELTTLEGDNNAAQRHRQHGRTNGTLDILHRADVVEVPKQCLWYDVGNTFGPTRDATVSIRIEDSLGKKENRNNDNGD